MNIRTTSCLAVLVATIGLLIAGCAEESVLSTDLGDNEHQIASPQNQNDLHKYGRTNGGVAVPFKATFVTAGGGVPSGDCEEEPGRLIGLNIQSGKDPETGEDLGPHVSTQLGRFDVDIEFCMDFTDTANSATGPNGEPLVEGESVPYWDGIGTFVAANGHELYFTIEGEVLPSDHPDYLLEFFDTFEFTGGTGRFAGASGSGVTSSFVNPPITEHYWSGTLILPRGN